MTNQIVQVIVFVTALVLMTGALLSHTLFQKTVAVDPKQVVLCSSPENTIVVTINELGFSPKTISVKACDQVVFQNNGRAYHEPAFGPHPQHLLYPGFLGKVIGPGEKNNLVLTAFGTYEIHDHLNEELEAELVINQR